MQRRHLLATGAVALTGLAALGTGRILMAAHTPTEVTFTTLDRDANYWKDKVSADAWQVLFKEATERAGTSELNNEKRDGTFICAACYLPLFKSEWKYESGTGWPSYFDVIQDHVGFKTDYKIIYPRKEYHCARCGGHQGHVFEDGPEPTGLRYCNNGVALRFVAADETLPELRG